MICQMFKLDKVFIIKFNHNFSDTVAYYSFYHLYPNVKDKNNFLYLGERDVLPINLYIADLEIIDEKDAIYPQLIRQLAYALNAKASEIYSRETKIYNRLMKEDNYLQELANEIDHSLSN